MIFAFILGLEQHYVPPTALTAPRHVVLQVSTWPPLRHTTLDDRTGACGDHLVRPSV